LDETGLILGLNKTHARSQVGTRVRELKPFYGAAKITVIGALSTNKVLVLMTMNDSRDRLAFSVFIDQCLCPHLWRGAVVVMNNLPVHKVAAIVPMIEAVGASFIYLSPYSRLF
jgi:putative transposase